MIDWHHLFGWTLTDYFRNSNYQVNLEKDLSIKPQQLDVLIIEKSEGKTHSRIARRFRKFVEAQLIKL